MSNEKMTEKAVVARNKTNTKIKESSNAAYKEGNEESNKQKGKEKNKSTIEAASALTCLGDEDDEGEVEEKILSEVKKRYIPEHKKPDAAFTFPEKLMQMMKLAEKEDSEKFCIAWLKDGKCFVIRDPEEFTQTVLPKFFKATKFSSFTRKLYRWGFRQVNRGIGPDDPIIFGNDNFQRDNADLMTKMRSVTAAAIRKQSFDMPLEDYDGSRKRSFDLQDLGMQELEKRKRILLDQMLMNEQKMINQQNNMPSGGMFDQNVFQQPMNHLNLTSNSNIFQSNGMQPKPSFKQMQGHGLSFNDLKRNALFQMTSLQSQQQSQIQAPPLKQSLQPYNAASTAEIVNAAIDALRFAS